MSELILTAIVGSLRTGSANAALARAAQNVAPDDVAVDLHNVADIPLYNGDVEDAGLPAAVASLHATALASDGLVLFSPEYNGSFPAVTKNAIDWLSRPPRSWEGTGITMVSASPGPRAGLGVREHFASIMARQPTRLFETMGVGSYGEKMNGDGEFDDEATLTDLGDFLSRFAAFCREAQ